MNDAVWLRAPSSAPPRGSREAQGRGHLPAQCSGTMPRLTQTQGQGRGGLPRLQPSCLRNALPPPRWALTAQVKSPQDQASPVPGGLGVTAIPVGVFPSHTPWTAQHPAPSLPPTSSRKTPPCCQGWARPSRGLQQQRVSPGKGLWSQGGRSPKFT